MLPSCLVQREEFFIELREGSQNTHHRRLRNTNAIGNPAFKGPNRDTHLGGDVLLSTPVALDFIPESLSVTKKSFHEWVPYKGNFRQPRSSLADISVMSNEISTEHRDLIQSNEENIRQ
jgi:hypothetical protein